MNRWALPTCVSAFACTLFLVPGRAAGQSLDLGTAGNAANWFITGAGATASPAFQVAANGPGEISLTSNALPDGIFVGGGSLAKFNGCWYADEFFSVPSYASNVRLAFDSLYGNDRAVLTLNGTIIGDGNYTGFTGPGVMAFSPGSLDVVYTFTGTKSGIVTSGFVFGGVNNLRLIINNTGVVPMDAPTATFNGGGDGTDASVNITLTYSVPEPSSLVLLLGCGAISLAAYAWRRQRRVV